MPSRITPAAFLIHTIHAPARGNVDRVPENSPTTTSSAVMPSEKTNRYVKPNTPLRVVATHVNTAANAGVQHGKAKEKQQVPNDQAGPGVRAHGPEQRAREAGEEAEDRVEQREAGGVGEGESGRAGPRRRTRARPRDDSGGDRDHRIDARGQARDESGPEQRHEREQRMVTQG